MTPEHFIATWKDNPLTERAGAQQWFSDLCDLLGVDKPRDSENYCFERGAKKSGGSNGWADVWKRAFFGWENKNPGRDLREALKQLLDYYLNLENPPLLVVSDRERIIIHTTFPGYPDEPREIRIEELIDPAKREILRWVFTDPEKLKPSRSFKAITEEAAARFANLAEKMRRRNLDSQQVAHFLVQCLFCMFAEDERLLPEDLFADLLKNAGGDIAKAHDRIHRLFTAMQKPDGVYGDHDIPWFNGGLFQVIDIPALIPADLAELHAVSRDMDWRDIDPTIFGTLFERGLDPKTRAPLGAHYTDVDTINKLIDPVITQPLLREWDTAKALIEAGVVKGEKTKAYKRAQQAYQGFLLRLQEFRVLDAACGSGNFLYLSLKALRDLEKRVRVEARDLGIHEPQIMLMTGPHNILGLEINEYAAELARVTVWIGDIQWCRRNGYQHATHPILQPLNGIQHRDALINPDGTEAEWPKADVIVGNPPFLGGSKKRGELGSNYFDALNKVYSEHVPGGADLVCYWFHKAHRQIITDQLRNAGLVATQAIRAGSNRKVLDAIVADTGIFEAWSDEPWVNEGAAVRVSLICFGKPDSPPDSEASRAMLNGEPVAVIHSDLTGESPDGRGGLNLTLAKPLTQNSNTSFEGTKKYGDFDIPGDLARQWLKLPNPNGKPNSLVVKPWANGQDIAKRPSDTWIIDFGVDLTEGDAAMFEFPFQHVLQKVKPYRQTVNRERTRRNWWLHEEARVAMRKALGDLVRFIVTPRVAKHRFFVWKDIGCLPDTRLCVIARSDDTTFGILSSRAHECWALANASIHGDGSDGGRPTYNGRTCFETFPFPTGLTPADTNGTALPEQPGILLPPIAEDRRSAARAIALAAIEFNQLRENWLNPPDWVDWIITPEEEQAGFPRRPVAKPGFEADLKKRTLTNLYNARPAWLTLAHEKLDQAVAAAYGWDDYTPDMADEEILRRLLTPNLERSSLGRAS